MRYEIVFPCAENETEIVRAFMFMRGRKAREGTWDLPPEGAETRRETGRVAERDGPCPRPPLPVEQALTATHMNSTPFIFFADSFTSQVLWTLLRDVKFGEAVSYKQLADLTGNGRAARAVGGAMRSNPIPIIIPCHRVICSSGQTGNYGGGNLMKEWLLSHEKLQKEKLAY
ncbi:PREDICTED: methylated-DNA--protein-cysteine methyltransferase [Phaethon lepturus]|uniref:methylated-DNA--protein-cysteine methyltransferase n=1 Tax=Phaethon lepturus TaxID=97097 RepID=UPI000530AAB0|nr:PREDICTED: methylated-DNA--protein-cysteine methyltransferase [Phaethon lepturus]